ncbi:MAG TPA: transporter [Thiobacillus sp.]|uniref:transporter n=1 Tax=Acidovorax sp. TaxID=1872122 RepID=UPI002619DF29|nr:transporter [Acidovorax sp.]HQT19175.1 transporter [Acidovorax defluvii]HQT71535.1 transporter [Thiobacillus sp.]
MDSNKESKGTSYNATFRERAARRVTETGWRWTRAVVLVAIAAAATGAQAVDVDAGDYTALPAGTNLGLVYYQHAERNKLYSGGNQVPINAGLDSDVGILRGVHFMKIGDYIVDPQFLLPFGKLKGKDGLSALGSGSGTGDLILAATAWLVNDPKAKTYFGITPFLFLPTGTYDRSKALNLGENRWKFALQGGYITPLSESVTLDMIGDVTVFGKNDDFGAGATSQTLKQKAQFQVQSYLRYHVSPAFDLRAGLSHTWGGETTVNGVNQNDRGATSKFSLGGAYFIGPKTQLLATYGRDMDVRQGLKESGRINLRVLQIF